MITSKLDDRYDVSSVRDLLRVVRNKRHHWHDMPSDLRARLGLHEATPDALGSYFEAKSVAAAVATLRPADLA